MERNQGRNSNLVYGICTNTGGKKDGTPCSKCQNKEKQAIRASKEFVCEECGESLTKVDPPRSKPPKWLFVILALVVIAGIVIAIVMISRNAAEKEQEQAREHARLDSIAKAEADSLNIELAAEQARLDSIAEMERALLEQARLDSIENAKNQQKKQNQASIDYGKWSGSWKSGKPNGTGTMRYTKEHLIDSRDPQKRVAQKGDYIIGEFFEGKLIQGVWYDASNTVKGSIIIGM